MTSTEAASPAVDGRAGAGPLRIASVGLGAIGCAAAQGCADAPDLELVAAFDPARAGDDLGGVTVETRVSDRRELDADVVLLATGSALADLAGDLLHVVGLGVDVVSTCEELVYPWRRSPEVASELHLAAREAGRRILGCGVNPGFVMDALPVTLAGASLGAGRIRVQRLVNLDRRRPQLRAKMGVGRTPAQWRADAAESVLGHYGLVESAQLCAVGLGWDIRDEQFSREPLVGGGAVVGVRERARVRDGAGRTVELELEFRVGGADLDRIEVDGSPPVAAVLEGGMQGDDATVARMLHCARTISAMPPGLRLPIEAPPWRQDAG